MKIAVLGPQGTFCDKAYLEYAKMIKKNGENIVLEPVYCSTIDEVFESVAPDSDLETACEYGIAPIENTLDGYVQRTLDLLLEKEVHIIEENMVSVQFSLIGNVTSTEKIEKLFVQFKSNGQCRHFINSLSDVNIVTTESNMESYYKIGKEKGYAAIVPAHVAMAENENGERFVIDNVTDAKNNHTRFVVFKKGRTDETAVIRESGRIKIPVYIMPESDRPGILYEILRSFYEKKINLISIMSRPTKQELGTYNFYVEIDGHIEARDTILDTLKEIAKENRIKVLGIYGE